MPAMSQFDAEEKQSAVFRSIFVRYSPDIEQPEKDEPETTQALVETLRSISEQTLKDGGQVLRSVHAKTHEISTEKSRFPQRFPRILRKVYSPNRADIRS